MKPKRLFTIAILSLLFFSAIPVSGQEISTVAEIYDFDVGDVFHYYSDYFHMTVHKTLYEITDKYYSPSNDTLYYTRDYKSAWKDFQGTIWNYSFGTQTIYYTELDSLILNGEFVYVGLFNGRIYNLYNPCECEWLGYAEGVGLVEDLLFICGTGEFDHNIELRYYKKGDEEWGTPLNLYTEITESYQNSDISIYPNPAKETIYIKFLSNDKVTNPTLELMTLTGNLIRTFKLNNRKSSISIDYLPAGIYLYMIKSGTTILKQGKIVKQ